MCGIIGAIAQRPVINILLQGLFCLEYRGYDSAGIAVLNKAKYKIQIVRTKGKVHMLAKKLEGRSLQGYIGIAHTRWATHGAPTEKNAHPLCSENIVSIVHNGVIENHVLLRQKLKKLGYIFNTETDTEVILHLLNYHIKMKKELLQAIQQVTRELRGSYALAIISTITPEVLYAVRYRSPLVVGLGVSENFIASDISALLSVTQKFIYLEEGDIAKIKIDAVSIYDQFGKSVKRPVQSSQVDSDAMTKGKSRHFMQKEIFEQPKVVLDTISEYLVHNAVNVKNFDQKALSIFKKTKRLQIVACGTSFHAALVGRYWVESLAGIPCQVEIASENRYRASAVEHNTLYIAISQSGETADTLAALRQAKKVGYIATLGICNVSNSSIAREADLVFLTRAGIEVGVAATKTFTAQLVVLLLLSFLFQRRNNGKQGSIIDHLRNLPKLLKKVLLDLEAPIKSLSKRFVNKQHALFLGRGILFPIALEGALKLKEVSYIHAEGFPAGELKHGPLALIDKSMPIIIVASNNYLIKKLELNIQEVKARGGELYIFMDEQISSKFQEANDCEGNNCLVMQMPSVADVISPIAYVIPLQLLAYYVAILKGTDVDQPRNLAKSVTVE
ncbi:glutamine--fructose-6-phosphate transaminase (isomerizing) [Coxiella endosymbiont of Amblyomma americanum]|uniref:glutamine--fructose-6-phosphate transaminase (isomerizing) n=1 Tax=Coxiella endosymbiont of Amblyomma americanum TaxID=325775 RepID=UPI00057FC297|nr:glutamine--fructose-6-phosphate transaminase (isomerizing) [Coxiella endosymbiont of Amblyomma americanum]AJC50186.1 glucosamine--fructose-6-phosphate aminotransferase [Coxiella endosymbiont of Amblyomma americanum]AUJ58547.1 glutamine--fructose-6-phosphate aminotransferase [Coxiella-like endosymbiont of Amblyomma americanum]